MRAYLDSSALLKRVVAESESDALQDALDASAADGDALVASSLAWIEVARAVQARGHGPAAAVTDAVDKALSGVAEHPISSEVVSLARRVQPQTLRTLDAIHLASAILLDVDTVIAYDRCLADACLANGLHVRAPGADQH